MENKLIVQGGGKRTNENISAVLKKCNEYLQNFQFGISVKSMCQWCGIDIKTFYNYLKNEVEKNYSFYDEQKVLDAVGNQIFLSFQEIKKEIEKRKQEDVLTAARCFAIIQNGNSKDSDKIAAATALIKLSGNKEQRMRISNNQNAQDAANDFESENEMIEEKIEDVVIFINGEKKVID